MNKMRLVRLMTGFLMGSLLAFLLEGSLIIMYNLVCRWMGSTGYQPDWYILLPLPIFVGIGFAKTIVRLPLGDYD